MVIPSIWWDEEGKPILIKDQRAAVSLAKDYEETTNKTVPPFCSSLCRFLGSKAF